MLDNVNQTYSGNRKGKELKKTLLMLDGLTKKFGAHVALNNVSIEVKEGRILALLGENGAGKSTLIKTLAGIHKKDGGHIYFEDTEIENANSLNTIDDRPISFIHQDLGLVEWMTVTENIGLTLGFPKTFGLIDWAQAKQKAHDVLDNVGMDIDPDERIFNLSSAEKSLLAIARALATNAKVLILDEPTASLAASDVEQMFTVLRALKEKGVGMIYVSHRLDEIHQICDDVVVLRDGNYIGGGKVEDFNTKELVKMIVGTEKPLQFRSKPQPDAEVACRIENLRVGELDPFNLEIKHGELVALAGLRGAGQEQIGQALFGRIQIKSGDVYIHNDKIHITDPASSIKQGISMVASDRVKESICPMMSIAENINLNPTNMGSGLLSHISKAEEEDNAYKHIENYEIRPPNPHIPIKALSGGNQQKVILARWFSLEKPLLIMDNPTAGVDIGARAEIYKLMNVALEEGMAIIVISSDFEEIVNISNRALIFNRGEVVKELLDEDVTFAGLLEYASG